jgi:hypothetical protein
MYKQNKNGDKQYKNVRYGEVAKQAEQRESGTEFSIVTRCI